MPAILAAMALAIGLPLAAASFAAAAAADLTVFAAASLKQALDAQVRQFEARSGKRVIVSYAGSNALAKQIEAGAPADVFFSADTDWMDYLNARALLVPGSRADVLRNRLVLIAPADSTLALKIAPHFTLADALGPEKLAMADPDSVPAGRYGKASLETLGVWSSVVKKLVRTENVRAALVLVARGEASLGIVYATDARAEHAVRIVDTFPDSSHAPIVYPIAITAASRSPAAMPLVAYLVSEEAQATWTRYGFLPVEQAAR